MSFFGEFPNLMEEAMSGELSLRYWPNPVLSMACDPIPEEGFGPHLVELGEQMVELMQTAEGHGLAAPQVGSLQRIFVMRFDNLVTTSQPYPPAVICNPVLELSPVVRSRQEGCLSFPGILEHVWRALEVVMQYRTPEGEAREMVLADNEARIVQHETDHLNGIMFFNRLRMRKTERRQVEARWKASGDAHIRHSENRIAFCRQGRKNHAQYLRFPPRSEYLLSGDFFHEEPDSK